MSAIRTSAEVRSFTKLFVGGEWVTPSSGKLIDVISPFTEEVISQVPEAQDADVDRAVAAARRAFDEGPWPRMAPAERSAALQRVASALDSRLEEMALTFTAEIGAPIALSRAIHDLAPRMWRSNANLNVEIAREERRQGEDGESLILREPIGVVGTVIPWNGPVTTASLKIASALAAGCTVVLKPAPEGPLTTFLLAEALEEADLPEGVISILPAGREVGAHLVQHRSVDKVAFTGSTIAGRKVMSDCGDRIARVSLELGGKSAGILADDIEFDDVLPSLVPAGVGHSGQVCAAITRILVSRKRESELIDAIAAMLSEMTVGDPMDPGTTIGPLAMERQRDRVEQYIAAGRREQARLVVGGGRPSHLHRGWFIEPTLFAGVDNRMQIAQEEIFGPVLCVIPYSDYDDAVRIANDSQYGLSGAIYTQDLELGESLARRVRTGQIFVNSAGVCVVQPYGGYKQSGIGREGGVEGIEMYFETKVVRGV